MSAGLKPDNHLVRAILTTPFCCLPFGVVAIVQAANVDSAWSTGRHDEAVRLSTSAKNWSIASAVTGVVVLLVYVVSIGSLLTMN